MQTKKIIAAFLVIAVAVSGFVAGLILLRERQDIAEKAAVPGGRATVSFNPATGNFNVGDVIQTGVYFNTDNVAVSGVAVRVRYPFSGTTPEVTVSSLTINPVLLSSGDWTCPTQNSSQEGGNVIIDIACVNQKATGFATNQNTLLATITLRVQRAPATNPLVLTFDPVESVITRRSDNQDDLLIPESTGRFNIAGAGPSGSPSPTVATVSPTRSVASPTPTVKLTTTVSTTKTPTPSALTGAGVPAPTYLGLAFAMVVIFAALLLAV